jgi:uncharacterized membrane protein YhaH (DUF805 family)
MSEPLYSPPPPPPIAPPPAGGGALQQVQGPAIGLLVTAIIGIVLGLFSLLGNVFGIGMSGLQNIGGGSGATDRYMQYMSGGLGIVFAIIGLAISGFVIWAALQMKQLRNWNMAVAASVVAMIPCIGPCCVIGLPIGIWSLIVLMKPEVKAAFTP